MDNTEFLGAINELAAEKNIAKEVIFNAIEEALMTACKQSYRHTDNVKVLVDHETGEYHVYVTKEVVEDDAVFDPEIEVSILDAKEIDDSFELGDMINIEIKSKEFGRIAASSAKNVLLQSFREEERRVVYDEYVSMEKTVVTGIVQRVEDKRAIVNLGSSDATLTEREQIKGETLKTGDRIKVYILEVKDSRRGPKIYVSRTHPDLVKRLFEEEVTEVRDGIVEIKNISREAGSRTKIAVWSNNEDVDAVGACVGMNGSRVNSIVEELRNEKIDIINWDENPAKLIENSLSPAKVISVIADSEEKTAKVVVPDYQLSLAIGKEGQNARLAARLTGYKIDIKSETQAKESGEFDFLNYESEYDDDEYYEDDEYIEE
ncbi:MAG: transcription termination factor NusA [Lachnospiraceae bacterium]|jgi:N utilization substance protein A|nr:transcription termination factor NusA [Lachnospiraceae bacterium]SEI41516.1 NusA antitermination factor [Lachnospiraceae bacterium A10]